MAVFRPFRAVRPRKENAAEVAALPYDVMSSDEAREIAGGEPLSFLHIDRAEIDFPKGTSPYAAEVYEKARENLKELSKKGVLEKDAEPHFYIYRLTWQGRSQAGLVGCASIDDYQNGIVKKHELTRAEKEEDRIKHVNTTNANTGPIFLAARKEAGLGATLEEQIQSAEKLYDFTSSDEVRHEVWLLPTEISAHFSALLASDANGGDLPLYIADGHHRCASAVKVGLKRREQNPGWNGSEEFNFFLAVVFPEEQLHIMDYNRVVFDLNGLPNEEFLAKVAEKFEAEPCGADESPFAPPEKHMFGMFLGDGTADGGAWYKLRAKAEIIDEGSPVASLDANILQENLLAPTLGIGDPRTDSRIDFVGGIRGLSELERRVHLFTHTAAAFSLHPVSMKDLFDVADAGLIMPPKSTWFEPKLRSGLFIHELS